MSLKNGYWREAATVILTGNSPTGNKLNVLMMKRSSKSKFQPDSYVFPGGTLSDSDFDPVWDNLFERITGSRLKKFAKRFIERDTKPPMFTSDRPKGLIYPEIALRICAIRETFEESGVLLITDSAYEKTNLVKPHSSKSLDIKGWRRLVNKDAGNFYKLCDTLNVVPNVWGLYEWSNWLTPSMGKVEAPPKVPRRFDTMFYISCLSEIPESSTDNRETIDQQWDSPHHLIEMGQQGKLKMIHPQLYELSRLNNFQNVKSVLDFSVTREPKGITRYLPSILLCNKAVVSILPGDELYPTEPDYKGTKDMRTSDMTIEELNKAHPKCHRSLLRLGDLVQGKLFCNIPLPNGHVSPIQGNSSRL